MKKNVLLTTICPQNPEEPYFIQLALYYLKAYFIKHSQISKFVNIHVLQFSPYEKTPSIIDQIKKRSLQVVGFSCYEWNIIKILKIARVIKKDKPDTKIVLGGPESSPRAYQLLKNYDFIDAIVIGEGERTFKELLEYWLSNKRDICDISGVSCRKGNKVFITQKRQQISNLDEIPSPYLEKIIEDRLIRSTKTYIPSETMRGCAYKCHYCYYHKDFERLSYFSLLRIEKELKYLLGKAPLGIYLMDPTFNVNRKRAKEILRIFIKYNKTTKLHVELRAELLDQEIVDLLYRAKADFIEIGIQSINKKTLRLINRTFEPNLFKKNCLLLSKKGLPFEIQLIDGLPADNYENLKKAVDWLFLLKPRKIKIMRFMLLPGTYLRLNAGLFGIKYNRRPPYYSIKSDTFSAHDLEKTKELLGSVTILYNDGLLRSSLYPLVKKLGIDFSKICEEWNNWKHKEFSSLIRPSGNMKDNKKVKKEMEVSFINKWVEGLIISKWINHVVDFVEYLCQKYSKSHVTQQLLNSVRQDVKSFLTK